MTHPLLTIRLALKRRYAHEMAEVMSRWQLTVMEVDVLLFLGGNPQCDTATDMVQLRQLTKSHVSKAVEHLTEMGFIVQRRDEKNRRRVHLTLSDKALPVVAEGQKAQKRFVEALTQGLSEEDKEAMGRILEIVTRNAAQMADE